MEGAGSRRVDEGIREKGCKFECMSGTVSVRIVLVKSPNVGILFCVRAAEFTSNIDGKVFT